MKKQAKTIPFQAAAKYYRRTTAKRCQYWDGSTNDNGCAILPDNVVPAMVTRWGYQPNRYRRPKDAYVLHTGEWVYVADKVATDVGEYGAIYGGASKGHAFKRIEDRWVYDRHVSQTRDEGRDVVKIHIVDGRVVEIVCTQGEFKARICSTAWARSSRTTTWASPTPPRRSGPTRCRPSCRLHNPVITSSERGPGLRPPTRRGSDEVHRAAARSRL